MGEAPRINVVELTVSELSAALRRTVEDAYGYVRVRGEISGYRGPHSSGHAYFALKDEGARIEAVIWKTALARMRIKPQEGLEMIATGRLTTYPGRSTYQIVVEALEPAGIGALMALLEQRKRKLAAEGLFDEGRKQRLPFLPGLIGVVTSPTGAVIRDILHRLNERFARPVQLWPVKVQGEGAAEQIAAAIRGFNTLAQSGPLRRPDLIIVARGGGSLEDLWAFNEEAVVRAAAESRIPLISAIGHETDVTLIDFAADRRAPTPTAAAEMAVPVRIELITNIQGLARRGLACWRRAVELRRSELRACLRAWPGPDALLAAPRQRLDLAAERLPRALKANAQIHVTQFHRAAARVSPQLLQNRIRRDRERLDMWDARLSRALRANAKIHASQLHRVVGRLSLGLLRARLGRDRNRLDELAGRTGPAAGRLAERRRERLDGLTIRLGTARRANLDAHRVRLGRDRERLATALARARLAINGLVDRRIAAVDRAGQVLAALSYQGVLARGFTLVRDRAGKPLRSVGAITPGMRLDIEFADGRVPALAESPRPRISSVRPRGSRATDPAQGSLF
jgi:exodeoxyribonuclease VII large subunit